MNNVWVQSGNSYMISEVSSQLKTLPNGVYKVCIDPFDNLYLERSQDVFELPKKVYGVETGFINRVLKSYNNTGGNFGVLLNGLKGTGKTVTAKQIAMGLDQPIIVVGFHHKKLISFLNDIQQNVVVFVDEFEKIYNGYENSLLTIMDGAMNTKHRLFFLLTTNELRVDKNLLQRPGRVRYVKTFDDMSLNIIMEVVDDKLKFPHLRQCTIDFISQLPIITMDLVTSVIEEVNIHEEDPINFRDVFNIHSDRNELFNVYKILKTGDKEEVNTYATVSPNYFNTFSLGAEIYVAGRYMGTIVDVMSESEVKVRVWQENEKGEDEEVTNHYRFEKVNKTHRAFAFHPGAF